MRYLIKYRQNNETRFEQVETEKSLKEKLQEYNSEREKLRFKRLNFQSLNGKSE